MTDDLTAADLSQRVASEIKAAMVRRGMSGAALAKALGVSAAWVSYRLTGTQEIGLNDLQRIASILRVPVDELIGHAVRGDGSYVSVGYGARTVSGPAVTGTHAWPDHPIVAAAAQLGRAIPQQAGPRKTAPTGR